MMAAPNAYAASNLLRFGSHGLRVAVIQQELHDLGYRTGPQDGIFGPKTLRAVRRFQRQNELATDGIVGPLTFGAIAVDIRQQFDPVSKPFGRVTLSLGDTGPAVRTLQGDLLQLGYHPGPADGVFNHQTGRAVMAFQVRHGLAVDEVVGPLTTAAILMALGYNPGPIMQSSPGAATATQVASKASSASPNEASGTSASTAPSSSPASSPMVLGYYTQYSANSVASQDSLAAHTSQISAIAPLWYSLHADASLHTMGYNRAAVRAWSAQHGVAIYPLVINGGGNDAILLNPALRTQAISTLVSLAQRDGYPGFNIDFEMLNNGDELGLNAFIAQLAAAMHQIGKKVIVAVGPRTSNLNAYHVYDYQSLGQSADAIVLMTYDHHDNTSAAGPVAPIGWVDQVVQYALTQMPAQKILVGLAAYGYNWSSNGAYEVHDYQAVNQAKSFGVPIQWNATAGEDTYSYTANGVSHTVWFENGYTDAAKIALVGQYHLGGVAIWRLGDEDAHLWTALTALRP